MCESAFIDAMYVKGKKVRQEVAGPGRLSRKLGTTLCEGHVTVELCAAVSVCLLVPPTHLHSGSAGLNCNTQKDSHVLVPGVQGEGVLMWHCAVDSEGASLCRVGQGVGWCLSLLLRFG